MAGLFVACGLFLNPTWMLAGVEAGTDMPAFALSMAATNLALGARRPRSWALAGLLGGAAILTRFNAVSLIPAAVATVFAPDHARGRSSEGVSPAAASGRRWLTGLIPFTFGVALPLLAWAIVGHIATGGALRDRNYLNVAVEIYGVGGTWDEFLAGAGLRFDSMLDVLALDPVRVVIVLGRSAMLRWWQDIHQLVPPLLP